MAASFQEKKTALEWMIKHYQEAADRCWDNKYPLLSDFYLIYDYNMSKVEEYQIMLDKLLKEE